MEAVRVNRTCAFCAKREWQVSHLVHGVNAVICDECVAAAAGLPAAASLSAVCVDRALEEMLVRGGRLNVRLLGGAADPGPTAD
jgi:hypothetical protein